MSYSLYISYKDTCWHEKILLQMSDALALYNEMIFTDTYEGHWNVTHNEFGEFPYSTDSPLFPSFEEFQQVMNSLNIGQIKYVMRSKKKHCSYFCGLKRNA